MLEQLSQMVDIHYGKAPPFVGSPDDDGVPIYGTGGIYGVASRALFHGPAIVVPRKGSLGNPQYVEGAFWAADTTYALIPKRGVDARWIFYQLCAFDLTRLNEATGVPSISRDWLARSNLTWTEPADQQRIARILKTTDQTIEKTEALIAKHQQIKAGLMHDLFSLGLEPDGTIRGGNDRPTRWGAVPKHWDFLALGDGLVSRPANGYSPNESEKDDGYYVLGLGCLSPGGFSADHIKPIRLSDAAPKALLCEGDLLLSRANTPQLVGMCGIYEDIGLPCIYPDLMMRLKPNNRVSIRFIMHWLQSSMCRRAIKASAVGTSLSMVKLNARTVMQLPLAFPDDMIEQNQVVERLDAADKSLGSLKSDMSKLIYMKSGLMDVLLTGRT